MTMIHGSILTLMLFIQTNGQFRLDQILTPQDTLCVNNYYNWPQCIDTKKGYTCNCGPGFYWNTRICISDAVDSRLEFPEPQQPKNNSDQKPAFAYTLLLNKPFPQLDEFTMSMYMKPSTKNGHKSSKQCIFSYKYTRNGEKTPLIFSVCMQRYLEITIHNQTVQADLNRETINTDNWSHLVINWVSQTGAMDVFFDKKKVKLRRRVVSVGQGNPVESNGHMVLGQYSPDSADVYDLSLAYIGNLAHVNIWRYKFNQSQTDILHNDCTFTHCGDGVEWVDLREGTRGISRLRWPSGIEYSNSRCFSNNEALVTCDKYCSFSIGVQCKEETQESILWERTPVPRNKKTALLQQPCPGYDPTDNTTVLVMANRTCRAGADGVGKWAQAQMDNCLSPAFRVFARRVRSYVQSNTFDKAFQLALLSDLMNQTKKWTYDNPVDLSSTIASMSQLLNSQKDEIDLLMEQKRQTQVSSFSQTYTAANGLSYAESTNLINHYVTIVNELIDDKHDKAWNMTLPLGQLADELLQMIDNLTYVIAVSLKYHVLSQETVNKMYRGKFENIEIKVETMMGADFFGVIFPDPPDIDALKIEKDPAFISFLPTIKRSDVAKNSDYMCISAVRLSTFSRLLIDKSRFGDENNINTPVVAVRVYESKSDENQLTISNSSNVMLVLHFTDTHNISNPECVALLHGDNSQNRFWDTNPLACKIETNETNHVECRCMGQGFFAGTTDMYNENWQVAEPPPELMTVPSYLGCTISLFLCICTLAMLIYVGTASRTATMHKHFAVAVICNTATFMIGITLTFNETACKTFAILFHYFFLTMYAWLMNEGFNVYISITYTAHNQSTQENSGHWRYYIIGWGVPGVLVSAIVGSSFDTYFSEDMCWVAWPNIWLFTGPPVAMIAVTLLVMTFAAKENNEVSYTKNESANTMTDEDEETCSEDWEDGRPQRYHANAVWTQIILVTCTWAIAFLSLKFRTIVFKWVFFIFNSAQGAFLFVFFFLLNEEVRSVIKTKDIKQQLGWDVSNTGANPGGENGAEDTIPLNSDRERALYRSAAAVDGSTHEISQPLLRDSAQPRHSTDRSRYSGGLLDSRESDDMDCVITVSRMKDVELDTLTETSV